MSKIQDALRRIQEGSGPRPKKPADADDTNQIAKLVVAPPTETDDLENYDGRRVTVGDGVRGVAAMKYLMQAMREALGQ